MIKVSIVEDIPEIRNGLVSFISKEKNLCILDAFENAEIALYSIPNNIPDIVIMDINLPGMNGIECIEALKKEFPQIHFMIFTIYENDEKVFEALKAGASGYILKKTEPSRVVEALKELHDGGSPMSSQIARKLVSIFQNNQSQKSDEAAKLTKRELEILELLSKGFLYKEIADKTGISFGTVRQHIFHIYEKLHVHNKTEAINKVYGK